MSKYIVEYKSINKYNNNTISLNIYKSKRAHLIKFKKTSINSKSFLKSIHNF